MRKPGLTFALLACGLTFAVSLGVRTAALARSQAQEPSRAQGSAAPRDAHQQDGQAGRGQGRGQRRPFWWRDEAIQKELALTKAQIEKIDAIWTARLSYARPLFTERNQAEDKLDEMVRGRTVSTAILELQVDRFLALDNQLSKTRYVMLYNMYRELTDAQYKKLQDVRARRDRSGRGDTNRE